MAASGATSSMDEIVMSPYKLISPPNVGTISLNVSNNPKMDYTDLLPFSFMKWIKEKKAQNNCTTLVCFSLVAIVAASGATMPHAIAICRKSCWYIFHPMLRDAESWKR